MITKIGTTTFTTPSDREITMTRIVHAPRERVFEAWTNPEHLPKWFGRRGWTMPICQVDLRPGGKWHYVLQGPDGMKMGMRGVYQEITPPERLVSTESFDEFPADGETINTLLLSEEEEGKTTITITSLYASRETRDAVLKTKMAEGAAESLDRLAEYLYGYA